MKVRDADSDGEDSLDCDVETVSLVVIDSREAEILEWDEEIRKVCDVDVVGKRLGVFFLVTLMDREGGEHEAEGDPVLLIDMLLGTDTDMVGDTVGDVEIDDVGVTLVDVVLRPVTEHEGDVVHVTLVVLDLVLVADVDAVRDPVSD